MIEFKNINLYGISLKEQILKVIEEEKEFYSAIENNNLDNAVEEFYDTIQSKIGLLHKCFGITANDIMKEYNKHLNKIQNRPRIKE